MLRPPQHHRSDESYASGNDGGSIPDQPDLAKNKPNAKQAVAQSEADPRSVVICALSEVRLGALLAQPRSDTSLSSGQPVALGKLYNKVAFIEYLLDKSIYGNGEGICRHRRGGVHVFVVERRPHATVP